MLHLGPRPRVRVTVVRPDPCVCSQSRNLLSPPALFSFVPSTLGRHRKCRGPPGRHGLHCALLTATPRTRTVPGTPSWCQDGPVVQMVSGHQPFTQKLSSWIIFASSFCFTPSLKSNHAYLFVPVHSELSSFLIAAWFSMEYILKYHGFSLLNKYVF